MQSIFLSGAGFNDREVWVYSINLFIDRQEVGGLTSAGMRIRVCMGADKND